MLRGVDYMVLYGKTPNCCWLSIIMDDVEPNAFLSASQGMVLKSESSPHPSFSVPVSACGSEGFNSAIAPTMWRSPESRVLGSTVFAAVMLMATGQLTGTRHWHHGNEDQSQWKLQQMIAAFSGRCYCILAELFCPEPGRGILSAATSAILLPPSPLRLLLKKKYNPSFFETNENAVFWGNSTFARFQLRIYSFSVLL